jgi:hypothetical protein
MNWFSNGFLGVYAELLEKAKPQPPENKLEEIKQLRVRRFEEREEGRAGYDEAGRG